MKFLENELQQIMPNLSRLATPLVAAKILAKLGSSERVAFMPASTLQVIGAEKALFRHLRKGARPPKHGYIFQHPLVKAAPRETRGKIARALAGKMAIAAKQDYFGKKDTGDALEKQLDARVKRINSENTPNRRSNAIETGKNEFAGKKWPDKPRPFSGGKRKNR